MNLLVDTPPSSIAAGSGGRGRPYHHARRKLVEITRTGTAPIAEDGVKRIGELYRIEAELRGLDADTRLAGRQARSAPLVADMRTWLTHHRARVAGKSPLGEALAYIVKYWDGLCVFLTDGRGRRSA